MNWEKVTTLDQLVHLARCGTRVKTDPGGMVPKPKTAENLMAYSARGLQMIIRGGLWFECEEGATGAPEGTILARVQAQVDALGLSYTELGKRLGWSRQRVGQFMSAKSVQTRSLDHVLRVFSTTCGVR